jgi:lambda repressor-like predicted transcriptional regulator
MAKNPASDPNPALIASQQDECFALKLKGYSVRAIADKTGIARSTVQDRLEAAYKALVQPAAAEARAIELERYDAWLKRLEDKVTGMAASEEGITLDELCKVTATTTRVAERRARLMGLDAPIAVEARGELRVVVEGLDSEALT